MNKYSCSVTVRGIKKRCRKIDGHNFKLGNYDLDVNRNDVDEQARLRIEKEMKSWDVAKVQMLYTTISEDGFFKSFELFDTKHVNWKIEKGVYNEL